MAASREIAASDATAGPPPPPPTKRELRRSGTHRQSYASAAIAITDLRVGIDSGTC
jgi:hypothetical protein